MAWSRLFLDQDSNQAIVICVSIAGLITASVTTNRFDSRQRRPDANEDLREVLKRPLSAFPTIESEPLSFPHDP